MRRSGRYLRIVCLLAVGAAALATLRSAPGQVAVPAFQQPSQTAAPFLAPDAPAVGLSLDPAPAAMPADVANAVKLLVKPPQNPADAAPFARKPAGPEPTSAERAAVDRAIAILRDTAKRNKPVVDPDRDAKLAAVAKSINALHGSISKKDDDVFEMPPLVVGGAKLGEEEQDATRDAVKKAAAQLLGQLPEPAQTLPPIVNLPPAPPPAASCPSCGRGHGLGKPLHRLHEKGERVCDTCGGGWRCAPGHAPCQPCEAHDGPFGRMFCNFYECLCCPDPCYDPQWRQVANASLFVAGARPITQTEFRYDAMRGGVLPDRSEYIWARADGMGRGPKPPAGRLAEFRFAVDDLVMVTETAKDKLSAIVEVPYRAVSPELYDHGAGFGDMALGTKTLLFDCEMMQVSMMMKTYLPIGNTLKGVGNGHVTIEPSLLFALKLTSDCYVQGQLSEWIPIGGDPNYMGSMLHSHTSLNHVLYRFGPDIPLVGTLECNTYSFQDGAFTDPVLGPFQKSSNTTYVSAGPGLRLMFCEKLDIGFGTAFSLSEDNFAKQYYRTSIRLRF